MPTNLPAQPLLRVIRAKQRERKIDNRRDERIVALCFALSPLAVMLALLLFSSPEQRAAAYVCMEEQCAAP